MFSIYDGRTQFFQWDLDRKLIVNDPTIEKVHFCNRTGSCSLVRCVYEINGMFLVDVPNIILQESYRVNVYGYDANYTKHSQSFNVVARTKPEDYVYTENEVATWEALEERITQIEENGVSDETIAAAISEYLVENPIEAGATAEQAAQIEVNKQAIIDLEKEAATHATTSYVDNAVKNVKPDLTGYATETYVDNAIANAQIGGGSGGEIDLSNYATKKYVDDAVAAVPTADCNVVVVKSNDSASIQLEKTYAEIKSMVNEGKVVIILHNYELYYLYDKSNLIFRYVGEAKIKYLMVNSGSIMFRIIDLATKDNIPDVSGYQTAEQVNAAIVSYVGVIENGSY